MTLGLLTNLGLFQIDSIHADGNQVYCLFLCDQVISSKCLPIRCVLLTDKETRKGDMNNIGETHVGLYLGWTYS